MLPIRTPKIIMRTQKTFKDIYRSIDPVPPRLAFIRRIAEATMRSENAVRMWISGRQTPDPLCRQIIAKELGVPAEGLFPDKK